MVTQCTVFTWLSLVGNDLDHDGANIVDRVLRQCPVLVTLDLQHNDIGWHGGDSLARILLVCTALTELNLAGNSMGDSGSESIVAVLGGECQALKFLDVQENDIGSRRNRKRRTQATLTVCRKTAMFIPLHPRPQY